MGGDASAVALSAFVFLMLRLSSSVEEENWLEPPEFNLATGRNISATATCGLDEDNNAIVEEYCLIGGAHSEYDISVYINNGKYCNVCNKSNPQKWHPASNAIDGTNKWWMSPPLSRGMEYNNVNLTIDFGREFQVAYITIKMGNSPRPGVWVLEKSTNYGKTYEPWQYFADSDIECMKYFGVGRSVTPTADDSVLCVTDFSKAVPLSDGEIFVPLLKGRPSASNFANSSTLQNWTKATNVRLNLIHTKTLLGHLMSVMEGDSSVTRRYFYAIKDIHISGKCSCNGHADECGEFDPSGGNKHWCKCKHNTAGINCEICQDGFVQKPWSPSKIDDPFKCEPCNCFGHSDKCEYNATVDQLNLSLDINGKYEGGGVCKHCKHDTEGINCHKCKSGFYRPYKRPMNAKNACEKCRCNKQHSSGNCKDGDGMCECLPEYKPPFCKSCSRGYYGFPNCTPCEYEKSIEEPEETEPPIIPTSTTMLVTDPTPAPVTPNEMQCKLPLYPAHDPDVNAASGYRFGTEPRSRLEYKVVPARFKNRYDFSIEFNTMEPDGIIFYVADQRHIDYIALILKEGKLLYSFNCGSGAAHIATEETWNDGRWHSVAFSRQQTQGKLSVDHAVVIEGSSKGSTKALNVLPPFYVGGISEDSGADARNNLKGVNGSFPGCLRNFRMNGKSVGEPEVAQGVIPCSEKVEPGVFFSANGGYLRIANNFRVGIKIEIEMDIKPRNITGVILSVHGKRDFLVLQMVNGVIKLSVDNGKGAISAAYVPPHPHFFCDGKWHNIIAIKNKNMVSLAVDLEHVEPGVGVVGSSSTDTSHPLYLGGHVHGTQMRLRGLETRRPFVGCIRNLSINSKPISLGISQAIGNITMGVCPTN